MVNSEVPIIFLTAKSLKEDILEGFKIGADDYITKPFSMEELVFRIEAILRRVKGKKGKEITMYKSVISHSTPRSRCSLSATKSLSSQPRNRNS